MSHSDRLEAGAGGPQRGDPREVLTRAAEPPDLVLRYGDGPGALVDVFLPPSLGRPPGPSGLVVLVHGGFWRQEYDRTHLRPMANALARLDVVVALPEFRRLGGGGGWPTTGDDVMAALDRLPERIDGAAPGRVDPADRLVLAGHSAGGHLALWAALRSPDRVRRVVALAPVSDLVLAADMGLGDGAVAELLGGRPADVPDAYAAADPLPLLERDMPSVTIVQGADDLQVPAELNRAVAERHADQPRFRYVELAGVEHFALIDPLSVAWPTVRSALLNP